MARYLRLLARIRRIADNKYSYMNPGDRAALLQAAMVIEKLTAPDGATTKPVRCRRCGAEMVTDGQGDYYHRTRFTAYCPDGGWCEPRRIEKGASDDPYS